MLYRCQLILKHWQTDFLKEGLNRVRDLPRIQGSVAEFLQETAILETDFACQCCQDFNGVVDDARLVGKNVVDQHVRIYRGVIYWTERLLIVDFIPIKFLSAILNHILPCT